MDMTQSEEQLSKSDSLDPPTEAGQSQAEPAVVATQPTADPQPTAQPIGPFWLIPAQTGPEAMGAAINMGWTAPVIAKPGPSAAEIQAQKAAAHNQRLLILAIVAAVFLVHLPWLLYILTVHGCWGSFLDLCFAGTDTIAAEGDIDSLTADPFMFAQVAFFMLRIQSVLTTDWAQFSQALQLSTGVGSFVLTKIIAANGKIAQGSTSRMLLAGSCAASFGILFWAEIHLTGSTEFADLGGQTVMGYIDQELPEDFLSAGVAQSGLLKYLQFLRLADALILGAALAMPKSA